jgi:hypothetical protein
MKMDDNGAATAYPLAWPAGLPRTEPHLRARSGFSQTVKTATDFLMGEISRMGGQYGVLSTNIELRRDGLPYSGQKPPLDVGVAVYFLRKGKQMTFACDRWDRVQDNIHAIAKTIDAIRGIERWGSSDMMERAFAAFEALPAPEQWWQVLGVRADATVFEIDRAYRDLAKTAHPDQGGSDHEMARLNAAREQGRRAAA